MKWSRLVYCAAITALTTFLVMRGTSPWFTVPLAAFAVWWTFMCTRALWSVASFRVAIWRLHQAPSLSADDLTVPRKVKQWEWLSGTRRFRLRKPGAPSTGTASQQGDQLRPLGLLDT